MARVIIVEPKITREESDKNLEAIKETLVKIATELVEKGQNVAHQ